MKIQTFENGVLIEEREIEDFPITPNILGFNTQMLFNKSYVKLIDNASDKDAKARLELLSLRLELKPEITIEDLQIFKLIWDSLTASVFDGILLEEDNQAYNQIAESNNMPFRFRADFKMEILQQGTSND